MDITATIPDQKKAKIQDLSSIGEEQQQQKPLHNSK
jgi:hypothetical protein